MTSIRQQTGNVPDGEEIAVPISMGDFLAIEPEFSPICYPCPVG